jgi:uncharacterized protein YjbJ (UPF0337 family)
MSGADKASNKMQKFRGRFKQAMGRVFGSRALETEGRDEQRSADMKDAGEKVKDVFRPKGPRRRERPR